LGAEGGGVQAGKSQQKDATTVQKSQPFCHAAILTPPAMRANKKVASGNGVVF